MIKKGIFSAVATAVALTAGMAFAMDSEMEKCKVVDKNGKGLIKEHKADCKTGTHSCSTLNKASDTESWINVPKGMCAKINNAVNTGDWKEVPENIKEKIEVAR